MHRYTHRIGLSAINKLGIVTLLVAGVLMFGCDRKESGPAEQAGKEIDKAAVAAGKQVEKAGESIQNAAKGEKP